MGIEVAEAVSRVVVAVVAAAAVADKNGNDAPPFQTLSLYKK